MARLDAATRDRHGDLDGFWLDLMAQAVTEDHYVTQLVRVYGFEAPLESALAYTPNFVVADRRDLTRSGLIVQDLIALGMRPAAASRLPQCTEIAPFRDPLEALGWWYVSERASQLYNSVKRHIVSRIPHAANACAFLSSYDGVAAARWQQLGSILDQQAWKHGHEKIVEGAEAGFACATRWFRGNESIARGA